MKYVITDKNEAKVGGPYHHDLAKDLKGKVVAAGHCIRQADGTWKVWGSSIGFNIDAQISDAAILDVLVPIDHENDPYKENIQQPQEHLVNEATGITD